MNSKLVYCKPSLLNINHKRHQQDCVDGSGASSSTLDCGIGSIDNQNTGCGAGHVAETSSNPQACYNGTIAQSWDWGLTGCETGTSANSNGGTNCSGGSKADATRSTCETGGSPTNW
ncbi:MAG: hypothetical protein ABIA04_12145 [Pseudomonadota bacterium]